MPNAYTLYGELKADTTSFKNALRDADAALLGTKNAIEQVESRAESLGKNTAVTAQGFNNLRASVDAAKEKLRLTAEAFARGDATAGQMRSAILGVENATNRFNTRLANTNARLTDFAHKAAEVASKIKAVSASIQSAGTSLTVGLTAPLAALGAVSIKTASDIDGLRNKLAAATGSVEAANKKLVELQRLARDNAGVFTSGAADLFAYFKAMKVGDETINELIKSFGRLKLANENLDIKEFARNLSQLFDQKFEMSDLKQAIGVFPQFGQIAQKAFGLAGSSLDEVQKGLQDLVVSGKLTREEFFRLFAAAVQGDQVFSKLNDTVGIRFAKMLERLQFSLQPLGQAILNIVEPIAARLEPLLVSLGEKFASLSPTMQAIIVGFGALVAALGPALVAIGAVVGAVVSIAGAISAAVAAVGGLAVAGPIIAGFILFIGELAAAAAILHKAWTENWGGIQEKTQFVMETVQQVVTSAMEQIRLAIELGSKLINGNWEGAWQTFLKIVEKHTAMLVSVLNRVLPVLGQWGLAITKKLGEWAVKAISYVAYIFATLPIQLLKLIPVLAKAGLEIGKAIWEGVKAGLSPGGSLANVNVNATPTTSPASFFDDIAKAVGLDKLQTSVPTTAPTTTTMPSVMPTPAIAGGGLDAGLVNELLKELKAFHKNFIEGKGKGKLEVAVTDQDGRVANVTNGSPDDVRVTYGTFASAGGLTSF